MSELLQDILDETRRLSVKERALLAHSLIVSLDRVEPNSEVDAAWAEIATERLGQVQRGEVQAKTWEEIRDQLS